MDSVKRLTWLGIILIVGLLVMGACGKKMTDETKDDPTLTTDRETEGGSLESGDGYGFTIFDLDIEVNGEDMIAIDYDVSEKAEAEYENKSKGIDLNGTAAMDEVFILFNAIRVDKDTPEDQVISDILKHYELDDYSKFELTIDFDEGTKLRINESH